MNVYYIIPFLNELDLLHCLLQEVNSFVTKFVIVEGNCTFSGKSKSFNFEENRNKFNEYKDKIVYLKVDIQKYDGAWQLEHATRRIALEVLNIKSEDIVICGDADEIPREETFKTALLNLIFTKKAQTLGMQNCMYKLNGIVKGSHWLGAAMDYRKNIKTLQELRNNRDRFNIVSNGGWHYSYLGTPAQIKEKISSYAHKEINEKYNEQDIEKAIKNSRGFFDDRKVEWIENISYPRYVIENMEEFISRGLIANCYDIHD